MRPAPVWAIGLALLLAATTGAAPGIAQDDPLLTPPPSPVPLFAVPDLDLTGAEARAQEAILRARNEVRDLLGDASVDPAVLAEAYGRLGAMYHVHDIPAGAAAAYRNARALDPGHFRWAYLDGWLAQGIGRLDDALDAYRAARSIDPEYAPLSLREGEILAELNRPEAAQERLEAAVEQTGLEAAAAFRLGQLALQRRDFADAARWLHLALAADPDADLVYAPLARALRGLGDVEAARAALSRRGERAPLAEDRIVQELQDLDTGARRHFLQGLLDVRESRFQSGAEAFARGIAEDPDNLAARISYARALYLAGEPAAAREQLALVLDHQPNEPLTLFLMGLLLEADGEITEARIHYQNVLDVQPGHPGTSHHLGLLAFRQGDWDTAARQLDQTGRVMPENVLAQVLAMVAESRAKGESDDLGARLENLVDIAPWHPLPRYALSRLLSAAANPGIRDPERALVLAESLAVGAVIPPVHEALALALAANGDFEGARGALEQAAMAYRRGGALFLIPRLDTQLRRLDAGTLPAEAWPEDDPVLSPPPLEPRAVFQEYPTPRPF